MTQQSDLGWRLRISAERRSGAVGCGFAVSDRIAVTCAHVVAGRAAWWVRPLGHGVIGALCPVVFREPSWHTDVNPWPDIALLDLAPMRQHSLAPLASAVPPAPGTVLDVFGFPEPLDSFGQRAHLRVTGADSTGRWLQVDRLRHATSSDVAGPRWPEDVLVEGFSGSAAVDGVSGRVVGMVTWSARQLRLRAAWLLPLATLASYWPGLTASLPTALAVDPDFTAGLRQLDQGRYGDASRQLRLAAQRYPDEPDVYYYQALAALSGRRPANCPAEVIDQLENLLRRGVQAGTATPHVLGLWATIKEDCFVQRGLAELPPMASQLRVAISELDAEHAREIVRHVPAPQCRSWQLIKDRSLR
jgi:hypothetical protein